MKSSTVGMSAAFLLLSLVPIAKAQSFSIPRRVPLEPALKREFNKWRFTSARFPGLILETFYPIGWSRDGKLAYYIEPVDEACGCYFAKLVIQDLRTDKVVWEFKYDQDDTYDDKGVMTGPGNIRTLWGKYGDLFSKKLKENGIVAARFSLLGKNFLHRGRRFTATSDIKKGKNPDEDWDRVDIFKLSLTSPNWGEKVVYSADHSQEEYWFMLDAGVIGVVKSPVEDLVAIIAIEVMRGWEGPPHTGDIRVVGASLKPWSQTKTGSVSTYPVIWFAPINDPNKPAWEILPQEAKAGEVILSKRNELGILSNFAATPFFIDGKRYASVEGFWQMMLYPEGPADERAKDKRVTWKHTREQVAQMTAFEAKQAGTLAEENMKTLGIDWVTYNAKRFPYRSQTPGEHYKLIVAAMRAKLQQNPEVKRVLLATGNLILKPDHIQEPNAPPEWKYNEIWMQIRSELRRH